MLPIGGYKIKANPMRCFVACFYWPVQGHRIGTLDIDACCGRVAFEKEGPGGR